MLATYIAEAAPAARQSFAGRAASGSQPTISPYRTAEDTTDRDGAVVSVGSYSRLEWLSIVGCHIVH